MVRRRMKPTICGKCGASLIGLPLKQERWDTVDHVWVGFLDCPTCAAIYVCIWKGPPPVNGRNL